MAIEPVNVLLVDDADAKLRTLKRQLEANDDPESSVTPFTNPYKALQYLLDNPGAAEFVFVDHMIISQRPPSLSAGDPTAGQRN